MAESSLAEDSGARARATSIDSNSPGQFWFVATMYAGWALLIWFSRFAGSVQMDAGAGKILLFGACATNLLFYLISRGDLAHRPPADAMTLAQCVVGIAWATLLTFMSSDEGALAIGIYVSIVLFAMPRVSRPVLTQIILFAVVSYSTINFVKILVTDTQSIAAAHFYRMLIFAGTMLCLSSTGKYVCIKQRQLEAGYRRLETDLQKQNTSSTPDTYGRRYLHETLTREKGRTDRKNVPFGLCVFGAAGPESGAAMRARLEPLERLLRAELRDMDAVNRAQICGQCAPPDERRIYVLMPETNLSGARRACERLLAAAQAKFGPDLSTAGLCVGIAQYRRGERIEDLLARAEQALAAARRDGNGAIRDIERIDDGRVRAQVVQLGSRRT